jgi:hypothetical protein
MPLARVQIDDFLAAPHTIIMAVLKRDGSAQLTTTWYCWDVEAFWMSTTRRPKPRSRGYGRAEFAAFDEAAYEGVLAIVRRYVDDPERYLGDRHGESRVLIRIRPDRIVSWTPHDE